MLRSIGSQSQGMRKIIHIDMDAFYASVELKDRPELQHLPVVVSYHHPRAVVVAASYPARKFGLRSAMSMSQARQRCPELIVLEPNFEKYRQISEQIHQIFQRYTRLIEPLSLDEAYLDVTENLQDIASATEVAVRIQQDIVQATGLTASAGVAPNKFLAKIEMITHTICPSFHKRGKPAQLIFSSINPALSPNATEGFGNRTYSVAFCTS